jgi:hypothetical protein
MTSTVDPAACALFLLAAFIIAGCAQVAWLASSWSQRFAIPLDGGRTFRGRRIFGANKTMRGLVVMVPSTALAFAVVARLAGDDPASMGLWVFSPFEYALLGGWAGLGFMLGELPNSFAKRQLDIAPGAIAGGRTAAFWQFAADRADSGIGMLTALSLVAPTPWQTWALVVFVGWVVHWSFSLLMFRLRLKPRPA